MHLSSMTARLFALAGILALPVFVGALLSTFHYQTKVAELKQELFEDQQFADNKDLIVTRLARLERGLAKADSSLGSLQKALEGDLGQVKSGLGPIDQVELISVLDEVPPNLIDMKPLFEHGGPLSLEEAHSQVNLLEGGLKDLEAKVEKTSTLHADKIQFFKAMPNVIPVDGWVTSEFGFRRSPYSGVYKMHYGIDIAAPSGTAIRAPSDGKVIMADFKGGYGRKIVVDHGYGIITTYSHASKFFVKDGDVIKRGQELAAVGSTGASTGPHLHYEVHVDGIPTDPVPYLIE